MSSLELERLIREDPRICSDCEAFLAEGERDHQCDNCNQKDTERPDGSECGAVLRGYYSGAFDQ